MAASPGGRWQVAPYFSGLSFMALLLMVYKHGICFCVLGELELLIKLAPSRWKADR